MYVSSKSIVELRSAEWKAAFVAVFEAVLTAVLMEDFWGASNSLSSSPGMLVG